MTKRIITISIIVLAALAILYGGYVLVRRAYQVITGETTPPAPTAQILPKANIRVLSDEEVFDYWLLVNATTSEKEIYYLTRDGRIFKALQNQDELIAEQPIENLQSLKPSRNGSYVIVRFGSILNPQFSILSIKERSWQPLPLGVKSADFSPDATQIAILLAENGRQSLIIQDFGKNLSTSTQGQRPPRADSRRLLSLYQRGLELQWLTPEKVILTEPPSDLLLSQIWEVNTQTGNIRKMISDSFGLLVHWSDRGDLGVKYTKQANTPNLSLISNQGTILQELTTITFPQKCTIGEKSIFCATPLRMPELIRTEPNLLDSYLKKKIFTADTISIFERNNEGDFEFSRALTEFPIILNVSRLNLVENSLLFINELDERLYELILQ